MNIYLNCIVHFVYVFSKSSDYDYGGFKFIFLFILYRCPTIHIVPCISNSAYGTSNILKNMLKFNNFNGDIFIHPLCKKFVNNKVNNNNFVNNVKNLLF